MTTKAPQLRRTGSNGASLSTRVPLRAAAALLALVVALQSGCATVPKTQHQTTLGKVAIVTTAQEPDIKFEGMARSKAEGAAKGAGRTFIECLRLLGQGSCSGSICGAVVIVWLGVCGSATVVGSIVGAATAPWAGEVRAAEHTLSTAFNGETIQNALRDQIVAVALAQNTTLISVPTVSAPDATRPRDYGQLAAAGVETVLEVGLTKVVTEGSDIKRPLVLLMEAHVRLIRTADNSEIFSADYLYVGKRLKLSEWSANDAEPLLRALKAGYETLASHIYDNVFLLYPLPDRKDQSSGRFGAVYGLAPVYPHTRGPALMQEDSIFPIDYWTTIDRLQPTLSWQKFPRASDIKIAPEEMGRVTNVRYDLIIARERNLIPGDIIYRREGLAKNAHKIEIVLQPKTRYFWTVRARFDLDGRQRVTEWGSTHFVMREKCTAPSHLSYRFQTP
jgi:hypothetical protein